MSNVRNLLRHSSECTRGGPEVLDKTNGGGDNTTKNKLKRPENFRCFHSASKAYSTEQGKL